MNSTSVSVARGLYYPGLGKPARMICDEGESNEEDPRPLSQLEVMVVSNMPRGTHRTSSLGTCHTKWTSDKICAHKHTMQRLGRRHHTVSAVPALITVPF